jgi:hypothetical protein
METFGPRIHPYQHFGVPRGLSFKLSRVWLFWNLQICPSIFESGSHRVFLVTLTFAIISTIRQLNPGRTVFGLQVLTLRLSSHSMDNLCSVSTANAIPYIFQATRTQLRISSPAQIHLPTNAFCFRRFKTFHLHIFQLSAELILDSSWRFLATRSRTHHNSQSRSTNSCPPAPLRWLSASSRMARRRLQIRKCEPQHSYDCNGCLCRQKGKPIKSNTISCYLRDVASLISNYSGRDPRFTNPATKNWPLSFKAVLDECKRYEGTPQRADPYTLEMHDCLMASNNNIDANRDGLSTNTGSSFNIGSFQTGGEVAPNGTKRAFTLKDIQLYDANDRPVSITTSVRSPNSVASALITFSWQKNNDHGEERRLIRNIHCPAETQPPLSFRPPSRYRTHQPPSGCLQGQHSSCIPSQPCHLRRAEQPCTATLWLVCLRIEKVHTPLDPSGRLKFLLRWRSDANFAYLRNVPHLANEQNLAFRRMAEASLQLRS